MTFKLDFLPPIHGWHFANNFVNQIIGEWSTSGLCGGMAATAWDFFAAGLPIPSHYPEDFQTGPSGSFSRTTRDCRGPRTVTTMS